MKTNFYPDARNDFAKFVMESAERLNDWYMDQLRAVEEYGLFSLQHSAKCELTFGFSEMTEALDILEKIGTIGFRGRRMEYTEIPEMFAGEGRWIVAEYYVTDQAGNETPILKYVRGDLMGMFSDHYIIKWFSLPLIREIL